MNEEPNEGKSSAAEKRAVEGLDAAPPGRRGRRKAADVAVEPVHRHSPELAAALLQAPLQVQHYVAALEAENLGLQLEIAKLEAQQLSAQHRVMAREVHSAKGDHGLDMVELRKLFFGDPAVDNRRSEPAGDEAAEP